MSDILLLVAGRKNRRLLNDCLQEEAHTVYAPDPFSAEGRSALEEGAWELCIVDGPALSEHWWKVKLRRAKDEDEFLPFLLVTTHRQVTSTTRQLWRTVDDVILTPIKKDELRARIEILLRAQRYPRRWSERYNTLSEMAPVGIAMISAGGQITYANPQAEQMLSDDGDVVGRSVESWRLTDFEGNTCPRGERPFYRVAREKRKLYDLKWALERPSGERVLLSVNAAPLFDEHGELRAVLCSLYDVTERERRVQELREAKERAEEMSRLKSSLLANMDHEIRTPLTSLLGFAEILAEEACGEQRELAKLIQQSGERLHETFTSLLDLSQLESGTLELHPSQFDVAKELEKLCSPFAEQAAEGGVEFELRRPAPSVEACLDQSTLTRIVKNVLSNALKFTRDGSVTVTLEAEEDQITLRVADTGVGIGQSFLPELFEPFKQESSGLAREFPGNGLGLSITKKLVEQMGGAIDVESQKGVGTTFHIVLPRGIEHAPSSTAGVEAAP